MTAKSHYTLGFIIPREDVEQSKVSVAVMIRKYTQQFRKQVGFSPQQLRLGAVMHAHLCRELRNLLPEKLVRIATFDDMMVVEDESFDRSDKLLLSGERL